MLAAVIAVQAADVPSEPEITVLARKLRKLQLGLSIDAGSFRGCTIKVSSGDAFIDGTACAAARSCVAAGDQTSDALVACIDHGIAVAVSRQKIMEEGANARDR